MLMDVDGDVIVKRWNSYVCNNETVTAWKYHGIDGRNFKQLI